MIVKSFTRRSGVSGPRSQGFEKDSIVVTRELNSLLGHRCQLMVQCPACGGTHVHEGTVSLSSRPGEIQIDGRDYALGQVRAVLALSEPTGTEVPRRVFDLIFLSGIGLAALSAFRLWM